MINARKALFRSMKFSPWVPGRRAAIGVARQTGWVMRLIGGYSETNTCQSNWMRYGRERGGYPCFMDARSGKDGHSARLLDASRRAREAEARGDDPAAIAAWREYRLIRDGSRPAEILLEDGLNLSKTAERLVEDE